MTISDYFSKDEEINELKGKLAKQEEMTRIANEKIASVTKEREQFRSAVSALKISVEKYNCKAVNLIRGVIKLRLDGLLDMTNKEIGDRYFVSPDHIRTLSSLVKRGV